MFGRLRPGLVTERAVPVGAGETLPGFSADGIAPLSPASIVPGAQSIAREELVGRMRRDRFAYVNTTAHREAVSYFASVTEYHPWEWN